LFLVGYFYDIRRFGSCLYLSLQMFVNLLIQYYFIVGRVAQQYSDSLLAGRSGIESRWQRDFPYYTASSIITPVGGRPVHRLREDSLNLYTERPPTGMMIRDAV